MAEPRRDPAANGGAPRCRWCGNPGPVVLVDQPGYRFLIHTGSAECDWRSYPMRVVGCPECGLVSQGREPSEEVLSSIYSAHYSSYPIGAAPSVVRGRHEETLEFIDRIPVRGDVLEIGSYDGELLGELQRRGCRVIGCDPNSAAADAARSEYGVETRVEWFRAGLFPPGSFDLVIARLLLEHVFDPPDFMQALREVLRPGGWVLVEVPDCTADLESGALFWETEHATYFSRGALERALRRFGFEVAWTGRSRAGQRMFAAASLRDSEGGRDGEETGLEADRSRIGRFPAEHADYVQRAEQCLEGARAAGRPIASYGCGYFLSNLLSATSLCPAELAGVYDSNSKRWGLRIPEVRTVVAAPAELDRLGPGLVAVATHSYGQVLPRLEQFFRGGGEALVLVPKPRQVGGGAA